MEIPMGIAGSRRQTRSVAELTMPQRIRIIYGVKEPSFTEKLEHRARKIVKRAERKRNDDPVSSTLEQQLALALDHLDSMRAMHKELRRNLVRQECYADNELHDMEMRTPQYSPYRFPEREKLQRRLIKIEDERRRLAVDENDAVRESHKEILQLMGRGRQLGV